MAVAKGDAWRMGETMNEPGALLRKLLSCLETFDFDGIDGLLHDDAVFDFPYRSSNQIISGRVAIVEHLRAGLTAFLKSISFEVHALYPSQDGQFAISEHSSEGERAAGGMYRNRYVCVVQARDGRIVLYREYYNPQALAAT